VSHDDEPLFLSDRAGRAFFVGAAESPSARVKAQTKPVASVSTPSAEDQLLARAVIRSSRRDPVEVPLTPAR